MKRLQWSCLAAAGAFAIGTAGCPSPTHGIDAAPSNDANDAAALGDANDMDSSVGLHRCVRPLMIESIEDLGAFPLPSSEVASRDGTSSGLIAGRLLWTFGDTFVRHRNSTDNSNVISATAGWSTVATPLALEAPIDDGGLPNQFIPYTPEELAANRADPLNGWALWPGAVIDTGSPEALVLFQRIKRTNGSGFDSAGVGTARVAPNGAVARRDPNDLFANPLDAGVHDGAAIPLYGSGGVSVIDGYVYFFGCQSVGFFNSGCRVGRAPIARADDRTAFEFWNSTEWSSDITQAAIVIDHVGSGLSITLNPYLGCYLAVVGGVLNSSFTLRTSERLETRWNVSDGGVTVAAMPDSSVLPPSEGYDYLFQEHVALRSADGRQIVISYARPTGPFLGEVRLARITLH